ncbi:hypothetical protein [Thalassospira mesophila]|uniref:Uncharacterized protein n=1 Tax=Thalassospira mesophila TaxID=1293891 RepID=A0A1Y2L3X4_9PROT|nr:hypothetical protein [Thalassospira mesophila]OSQ39003.1 hypothetical protein TMES_09925 [Thalassospira mesophila]
MFDYTNWTPKNKADARLYVSINGVILLTMLATALASDGYKASMIIYFAVPSAVCSFITFVLLVGTGMSQHKDNEELPKGFWIFTSTYSIYCPDNHAMPPEKKSTWKQGAFASALYYTLTIYSIVGAGTAAVANAYINTPLKKSADLQVCASLFFYMKPSAIMFVPVLNLRYFNESCGEQIFRDFGRSTVFQKKEDKAWQTPSPIPQKDAETTPETHSAPSETPAK